MTNLYITNSFKYYADSLVRTSGFLIQKYMCNFYFRDIGYVIYTYVTSFVAIFSFSLTVTRTNLYHSKISCVGQRNRISISCTQCDNFSPFVKHSSLVICSYWSQRDDNLQPSSLNGLSNTKNFFPSDQQLPRLARSSKRTLQLYMLLCFICYLYVNRYVRDMISQENILLVCRFFNNINRCNYHQEVP